MNVLHKKYNHAEDGPIHHPLIPLSYESTKKYKKITETRNAILAFILSNINFFMLSYNLTIDFIVFI